MDIRELSLDYSVRNLDSDDINLIYNLSIDNPIFYEYCPPYVTRQSIQNDMKALPPNKKEDEKLYIGYFNGDELVAVLDLIINFPDEKTAYIGLFMVNKLFQGNGVGTKIIEELSLFLKKNGFNNISLAFAKGNPQSEAFWLKNEFFKTGHENHNEGYIAVILEKVL